MHTIRTILTTGALLLTATAIAQECPKGHFSGSIEVPNQTLKIEVDLDKTSKGWIGSISMPEQGASGLPLGSITSKEGKCIFIIKGAPGEPTFTAAVSAEGKTLAGEFTQGPGAFPFNMTRTGEAKVDVIKASPAVPKEFVGKWTGTLEAGQSLRLELTIVNSPEGATAELLSIDQGGAGIAVSSIEVKGTKLVLGVKAIAGGYKAEINKEGTELAGEWTQAGQGLPLKLTKAK